MIRDIVSIGVKCRDYGKITICVEIKYVNTVLFWDVKEYGTFLQMFRKKIFPPSSSSNPENGCNMFFQNFCKHLPDYMVSHSRTMRENLKFYTQCSFRPIKFS